MTTRILRRPRGRSTIVPPSPLVMREEAIAGKHVPGWWHRTLRAARRLPFPRRDRQYPPGGFEEDGCLYEAPSTRRGR